MKVMKKTNQSPNKRFSEILIFLFILLLPTQFGKHFFLNFSYLSGVRVDYLAPTIYVVDMLIFLLALFNLKIIFEFFTNKKILVFLGLLLFSVFFSISKPIAFYKFIRIIEFLIIFIVAKKSNISKVLLLFALLIGSGFELLLSLLQFVNKHSVQGIFYFFGERDIGLYRPGAAKIIFQGREFLRPYGTFSHPNSLAGFYLLAYFFILTNLNSFVNYKKNLWPFISKNLLLIFSSFLIFLSFSKVAILVFIFLNIVFYLKNKFIKKCFICLISKILVFSVIGFIFLSARGDPQSLINRVDLINNSLKIILTHPFFGVGIGNYLVGQNSLTTYSLSTLNQPVHNIFLILFSEVGILGGIILFLLFLNEIKLFAKKYFFIFFVVVFSGFFDHYWFTLIQNFFLLGFVAGLL